MQKPKQGEVVPQNTVLSSALFAGSALKNGLLTSKAIYSFVTQGLQFPGATYEEGRKEIVATGACLVLIVAGDIFLEKWMPQGGVEKVQTALESLKDKNALELNGNSF